MPDAPPKSRLATLVDRLLRRDRRAPEGDDAALARRLLKSAKAQHAVLAELARRLDALEQDVQALRDVAEKTLARARHIEPGVEALVRARFLEPETLPFPERLTAHRFRLHSQGEEDGITLGLFGRIGATTRRFVELGSGLSGGNSAVFATDLGWSGLMVDGDAAHIEQVSRRFPRVTAVASWITAENVNDLIAGHGLGGEIDLLSIDVDGNDYWIWNAVTVSSPRVVIVEYNSLFGPDRAVTIPYDPRFNRHHHRFIYYGASLAALARLARRKGYRLVAVSPSGVNAFFLRHDVGPEVPEVEPRRAYRLLEKYDLLIKEKHVDIYQWIDAEGLSLVEVE